MCPYPIKIKNPYYKGTSLIYPEYMRKEYYEVGCGKCLQCQTQKNQWLVTAADYEHNKHRIATFSTFTYDDNHVRMNEEETALTLDYRDMQLFWKRLRQRIYRDTGSRADISFICAGQYGEKGERPHYHAIIFGLDWKKHDKLITETWGLGDVKNLPLKSGGIQYVIRYQNRDINRNRKKYKIEKIAAPFVVHSIGFGKGFIDENMNDIIKRNGCYIGHKNRVQPIPSYYMRKMRLHRPIDYTPIKMEMEQMHIPKNKDGIYTKTQCEEYKYKKAELKEREMILKSREKKEPQEDFDKFLHESTNKDWTVI